MRASAETAFGPTALTRAARTAHRETSWLGRLRPRAGATRGGAFLPHGPGVNQALVGARQQARARGAEQADADDLILSLLAVTEGLVPTILSRLGASGPGLSAAIRDRCRPGC